MLLTIPLYTYHPWLQSVYNVLEWSWSWNPSATEKLYTDSFSQVSQGADHPSPQSPQCSRSSVRRCTGAGAPASRLASGDCQVVPLEEHQGKYGCPTDRKDTVQLVQGREFTGKTWSSVGVDNKWTSNVLSLFIDCFALIIITVGD